jgi:hypothetical protein
MHRNFCHMERSTLAPVEVKSTTPGSNRKVMSRGQLVGLALVLVSSGASLFSLNLSAATRRDTTITLLSASVERMPASLSFPDVRTARSDGEALSLYPAYLQYVLEVGNETDRTQAKRLSDLYGRLRARYPLQTANFLKGLRFEMVAKQELMGASPSQLSSHSPEMRRWVRKFIREWVREADEYLFRAVTTRGRG